MCGLMQYVCQISSGSSVLGIDRQDRNEGRPGNFFENMRVCANCLPGDACKRGYSRPVEWFATLQKPSTVCANFRFSSFMPYFMGPLRCESLTLCERQATIQLHCAPR